MYPSQVRIPTDETGRSKGFAFVDFNDLSSAHAARQLDGREIGPSRPSKIHVKPANGRENRGEGSKGKRDKANSVFVGNFGELDEREIE